MNAKENFYKAIEFIKRPGIENLIQYLESETDFFTAPASRNFHGNHEGGLLEHSVNVLHFALHNFNFVVSQKPELEYLKESIVICALFHDLCKTNQYEKAMKWTKDENDKWKQYSSWDINDKFPLGHGEKSIYVISRFIELTNAEAMAIRWHMGATEISTQLANTPQNYAYNQAIDNPLVRIIIAADMMSISLEEKRDLKKS